MINDDEGLHDVRQRTVVADDKTDTGHIVILCTFCFVKDVQFDLWIISGYFVCIA